MGSARLPHSRYRRWRGGPPRGQAPDWSSRKDVILELLRRLSVEAGSGRSSSSPGRAWEIAVGAERCTIANMTAGWARRPPSSSDSRTRRRTRRLRRETAFTPLSPDDSADYDDRIDVDLAAIRPLVMKAVVPVRSSRRGSHAPVDRWSRPLPAWRRSRPSSRRSSPGGTTSLSPPQSAVSARATP